MKWKILFLYAFFIFCTGCTMIHNTSVIKEPPTDKFVKVYKTLTITKCFKEKQKDPTKQCETKKFGRSGSGALVKVVKEYAVVLTSGHVCDSSHEISKNDPTFSYNLEEEIMIQNYQNRFFSAKVVIAELATQRSADLCSLVVMGLKGQDDDVKIETRAPKVGEDIYYMGAPLGIYHPPSVLLLRGIYSGQIDKFVSITSLPSHGGSSGGAVMSVSNKIYGVVFAVHPNFKNSTLIINHSRVKNFLLRTQKMLELFILQQDDT
tara:strand:+ start:286 stop:1074 length:789 start_codon:yes stop_codon:yes gene_type:complete